MANGQWEVVGGKSKKNKSDNSIKVKEKKNKENEVFAVPGKPISESKTIYSVFTEKSKETGTPNQKVNNAENTKSKDKAAHPQKKKKDKKSSPPSKTSLEENLALISEEDLKNVLATVKALYPASPLIWLKDVVSFFNLKIETPVSDPTFSGKPLGYPLILLNKNVCSLMVKTFNDSSAQTLHLFFEHCIQSMVQDILKGVYSMGYRVVLQCLAQEMPSVVLEKLQKCVELCRAHQNRQNICLSVMWAAGQAGINDLEAGFRVWNDLMFPLIGAKSCSNYAVEYLEKLVSSEDLMKLSKSMIGVRDLFPILDFIHSKDLMKSIQKKLIMMYPTIKMLSYGPEPETVLRNYFPSYLRRLEPQCPQSLKEEVLSSLVYCLEKDIRCYSLWRQLYSKHFVQSKLLIAHLNSKWGQLPPKFPKRCLYDTLSVFQVTNEELLNSGKKDPVEECMAVNKELLSKMNSQKFTWFRMILLVIFALSLLLSYDIWIHKSFEDSKTGKLMKDAGLLVMCTQVGDKMTYYYRKIYKLLETYVPIAHSWTQKTIIPYFDLFWRKLVSASVLLWNSTYDIRVWCNAKIPEVLAMIDEQGPLYVRKMRDLIEVVITFLATYVQIVLRHVWHSLETATLWIQSNTFLMNSLENIQKYLVTLAQILQERTLSFLTLIQSYTPSMT